MTQTRFTCTLAKANEPHIPDLRPHYNHGHGELLPVSNNRSNETDGTDYNAEHYAENSEAGGTLGRVKHGNVRKNQEY